MFGVDLVIVLLVVLAVVLIWRGPKILPKWGETLGRGVKATRKEIGDLQDETKKDDAPADADAGAGPATKGGSPPDG